MEDTEELLMAVKSAIRQTASAVSNHHPLEKLSGYALLTDDGLTTLTYMAVTRGVLDSGEGEDLLFSPTDWPLEYDSAAFSTARQQLSAMANRGDSREHAQLSFAVLVQALVDERTEGLFSPDVFLSVLSTAPSLRMEALEATAIQRLNNKNLVEARKRFLERWSG